MSLRQIIFLSLLTGLYLTFELAFNARLLDVVGGGASADQIHNIEIFGRSLSGIAVALVVLQILMTRRARSAQKKPRVFVILFLCLLLGICTYFSLETLVETLVTSSTPEFRRASTSIVLVQRALVDGGVELDGLHDDPELFARPEGKAFLALFPAMAVSVDRLDEKIHDAKLQLIIRQIESVAGGAGGYYKRYIQAVSEIKAQWQRYSKIPGGQGQEGKQEDKAWGDYVADLGKRGWTPSTIPPYARKTVIKKVRARIPVSAQWDPADEVSFREAVASQVHRRTVNAIPTVKGQKIPPGLDFPNFFAHSGIQTELRERLYLPNSVKLRLSYTNAAEFTTQVFAPMVKDRAQLDLRRYDASASSFADGGTNNKLGLDTARAAIVPPIALLFSLLGAIGHLSKLCYLLTKTLGMSVPTLGKHLRHAWIVPITVLLLLWLVLTFTENAVTSSRLYRYMQEQVHQADPESWKSGALTNVLHVVAVGQGYGYPINEFIRTRVLQGITYGYQASQH